MATFDAAKKAEILSGLASLSTLVAQTDVVAAPPAPAPAPSPAPTPAPAGGTGFAVRPFLFRADEARLRASIAAGDPEAVGSASNVDGQPQGFLTRMNAIYTNPGQTSLHWVAMAAWLQGNATMARSVRDQVMSIVNATPNGVTGHGSDFQHHEDTILRIAASTDLCFSQFSASDLVTVASYINGTCDNWVREKNTFWPGDAPFNNYWQNGFLGMVAAGICTEGFNPRAAEWRSLTQTMAQQYAQACVNGYSGPVQTEGHYYAQHVQHAIWGMYLFDRAMGTSLLAATRFDAAEHLQLQMYQQRSHLVNFFHVGSEANDVAAPHGFLTYPYWHQLAVLAESAGQTQRAAEAKAMLSYVMPRATWYQFSKAPYAFYWNIRRIASQPLTAKSDLMYAAPTPGAGLVGVRSAWQPGAEARSALMFATQFGGGQGAHWSHSNADAPGFQWDANGEWLVTDPGFFHSSGILGEAGSTYRGSIANIVFLAGVESNYSGGQPRVVFAEDNRSASVPHQYVQINAQPYWTTCSVNRREYVWLDDLRAAVVFDRIIGGTARSWRIHTQTAPVVSSASASVQTAGGRTMTVRNLLPAGGWAVDDLLAAGVTTRQCYRLRQDDGTDDYRSLKVLDVGGRVVSASMSAGPGYVQAELLIGGATRSVRFFDDGSHALVA